MFGAAGSRPGASVLLCRVAAYASSAKSRVDAGGFSPAVLSIFILPGDKSVQWQRRGWRSPGNCRCILTSLDVPWRMLRCGEGPEPWRRLAPPPPVAASLRHLRRGGGGELLEMGVRLNAWLESAWRGCVRFFPAVYRLQKPAFPTLYPLRRQKPRFYC